PHQACPSPGLGQAPPLPAPGADRAGHEHGAASIEAGGGYREYQLARRLTDPVRLDPDQPVARLIQVELDAEVAWSHLDHLGLRAEGVGPLLPTRCPYPDPHRIRVDQPARAVPEEGGHLDPTPSGPCLHTTSLWPPAGLSWSA